MADTNSDTQSADLPICRTCGVQYGAPREDCPICLDERQYVGWAGQQWTTLADLRTEHRNALHRATPSTTSPSSSTGMALVTLSIRSMTPP